MEGDDPDWTWIMPKVTAVTVALTALLLLGLTGCAGSAESAGDENAAPVVSEPAASEESDAPLTAQSPSNAGDDVDAAYLVTVRERLAGIRTQIPEVTDEQLIASGHDACDRIAAGESPENMSLIEGEELTNGYYMDSGAIIIAARLTMCPIE